MQKRHKNKQIYFNEQEHTTKKFVIPYISEMMSIGKETLVLEVGCAEAGNLKPFVDSGCLATGVDISCGRIELAKSFFQDHPKRQNLTLICEDIYKLDLKGKNFDLIIMRDVIEHLPNQKYFMDHVKKFLKPDGKISIAFPPWQNPFGGHQQICNSPFLSKLPYIHLLPLSIYKIVLNLFEKNRLKVEELISIKKTGISIENFEKIIKHNNFKIDKRTLFFINPNYETKFGMKPRKQCKLIGSIPWFRNFFTTAAYYIISK